MPRQRREGPDRGHARLRAPRRRSRRQPRRRAFRRSTTTGRCRAASRRSTSPSTAAQVGVLQGKGVVAGLKANGKYSQHPVVAELNGGSTDPNSFLFKGGYDKILKPLYKTGTFKKGPDQFVPGWDNQKAGTIFEQMLVKTGNKIDAVAAANDGLANAVVVALKAHGLKPIPLSGQDATPQGVQNIISGWQTMTVWKDTRVLAKAAATARSSSSRGRS